MPGENEPLVFIYGDPVEGFSFIGPVYGNDPATEELQEIARQNWDEYWWMAKLRPLEEALREAGVNPLQFGDNA